MLARGQRTLEADLHEDAGRAAYLAAFHAAQGLIYEREHRSLKTHQGVQSEFTRLIKAELTVTADLRGFLSRAHAFKTIADPHRRAAVPPTEEDVRLALQAAVRFVDEVARIANP
jgi:uncharacterized protein (UPF0332 family)